MVDLCGPPLQDSNLEQFAQTEALIVEETLSKPPSAQAVQEAVEAGDSLEVKIRAYAAAQHELPKPLIDQIGDRAHEIIVCHRHQIQG